MEKLQNKQEPTNIYKETTSIGTSKNAKPKEVFWVKKSKKTFFLFY